MMELDLEAPQMVHFMVEGMQHEGRYAKEISSKQKETSHICHHTTKHICRL